MSQHQNNSDDDCHLSTELVYSMKSCIETNRIKLLGYILPDYSADKVEINGRILCICKDHPTLPFAYDEASRDKASDSYFDI